MNLDRIKITGLFGTFNHDVRFKEGRITLVLGENGIGKTFILRIIKAFYDQDFTSLKSFYFDTVSFFFSEGNEETEVRVVKFIDKGEPNIKFLKNPSSKTKKNDKNANEEFVPKLEIEHKLPDRVRFNSTKLYWQNSLFDAEMDDDLDFLIRKCIPFTVEKIRPGVWLDHRRGRTFTSTELVNIYQQYFPTNILEQYKTPEWLKKITSSRKVIIIESQRLLNRIKSEDKKYQFAVLDYSQEIVEKIKSKKAEANDLASKLDRTYPKRLIEKIHTQDRLTNEELMGRLNQLESTRLLLNNVGLIDADETYIQSDINVQDIIKNVLQLYIEDSYSKLSIYDDLSRRISLFLNVINKRFNYKMVWVDKQKGFRCKSKINDDEIPLISLSSGEQHELVLFYQLIFNTGANTFLLVDEPEISLHISWQNEFINDLNDVIRINSIDILVATHSPDIIGKYWHLTNELKGDIALHNPNNKSENV